MNSVILKKDGKTYEIYDGSIIVEVEQKPKEFLYGDCTDALEVFKAKTPYDAGIFNDSKRKGRARRFNRI